MQQKLPHWRTPLSTSLNKSACPHRKNYSSLCYNSIQWTRPNANVGVISTDSGEFFGGRTQPKMKEEIIVDSCASKSTEQRAKRVSKMIHEICFSLRCESSHDIGPVRGNSLRQLFSIDLASFSRFVSSVCGGWFYGQFAASTVRAILTRTPSSGACFNQTCKNTLMLHPSILITVVIIQP